MKYYLPIKFASFMKYPVYFIHIVLLTLLTFIHRLGIAYMTCLKIKCFLVSTSSKLATLFSQSFLFINSE